MEFAVKDFTSLTFAIHVHSTSPGSCCSIVAAIGAVHLNVDRLLPLLCIAIIMTHPLAEELILASI